jgi:hypothetical protein
VPPVGTNSGLPGQNGQSSTRVVKARYCAALSRHTRQTLCAPSRARRAVLSLSGRATHATAFESECKMRASPAPLAPPRLVKGTAMNGMNGAPSPAARATNTAVAVRSRRVDSAAVRMLPRCPLDAYWRAYHTHVAHKRGRHGQCPSRMRLRRIA